MDRPDAVAEEPLFLDEPEDLSPPAPPETRPFDDLFADETASAAATMAPRHGIRHGVPSAWRAERTAHRGGHERVRTPLLVSLIALGLLIGFSVVTFLT